MARSVEALVRLSNTTIDQGVVVASGIWCEAFRVLKTLL
jgi:hypothetical protein